MVDYETSNGEKRIESSELMLSSFSRDPGVVREEMRIGGKLFEYLDKGYTKERQE